MKTYQFTENSIKKEMTRTELFSHFNGEYQPGKKVLPKKAKTIMKVNRQGGEITL